VRHEIVHSSAGNCHQWGCDIIKRVVDFNTRTGLGADPTHVFAILSQQMVVDVPQILVQAIIDEERLVGHCVTICQDLFGERTAMIYQLEIDDDARNGREEMLRSGWDQISAWAEHAGCTSIRAWAQNKRLAEVFKRFGMDNKDFQFVEAKI
jgi:hypothetical protein